MFHLIMAKTPVRISVRTPQSLRIRHSSRLLKPHGDALWDQAQDVAPNRLRKRLRPFTAREGDGDCYPRFAVAVLSITRHQGGARCALLQGRAVDFASPPDSKTRLRWCRRLRNPTKRLQIGLNISVQAGLYDLLCTELYIQITELSVTCENGNVWASGRVD